LNTSSLATGDGQTADISITPPFVDMGLNDGVYMGLNDGVYMGIGFVLGILFTLAFVCACKKGKKKPDDEFV